MNNPTIYLPFTLVPEAKTWAVGQVYRVKAVLRQTSADERGGTFEVVDITAVNDKDRGLRKFMLSEGGIVRV